MGSAPPARRAAVVRRRGFFGLLSAQAVSLVGTLFGEMAPYVIAKALGGPLVDRAGPRRVSVAADLVSAVLVGAIPLVHALGGLRFWVLLILVAGVGLARGPGDASKTTLVPEVAHGARVPLERVSPPPTAVPAAQPSPSAD